MIPEALGFGTLSGLGPLAALYGAIILSFIVAIMGGAAPMISGPSAIVTIFTAVIVSSYADTITEALTIVALSGMIQIAFGALRFGRFVNWVPFSVVRGVFAGVGAYLIVIQTLPALGEETEPGMGLIDVIRAWPYALTHIHLDTLSVALIALLIFAFWPERLHRILPNALVALVVSSMAAIFIFHAAPQHADTHIGLPEIHLPVLEHDHLMDAIKPAFILAFLGSIYSLLTAQVIDPIAGRSHQPNKELVGLGIGNTIAGLVGGMPGAASVPCSFLAARSGALTAVAGVACSVIMLIVLLTMAGLINYIPHAAFAGIFICIGWEMMDFRFLRRLPKMSKDILVVTLLTAILTVLADLLTAITVGFIAGTLANALRSQVREIDNTVSTPLLDSALFPEKADDLDPFSARVGLLSLRGHYSIASARQIVRALSPDMSGHQAVIFDFTDAVSMDSSAAMAIEELVENAVIGEGKGCIMIGVAGEVKETFDSLAILESVPEENFVEDMDAAKALARRLLET